MPGTSAIPMLTERDWITPIRERAKPIRGRTRHTSDVHSSMGNRRKTITVRVSSKTSLLEAVQSGVRLKKNRTPYDTRSATTIRTTDPRA